MVKKIYIFINGTFGPKDMVARALCEDGTPLGSHLSSSVGFAKHDMGIGSDWKHDTYKAHCPEGFELEWVDDPKIHEGFKKAVEANHNFPEAE